MHIPNPTASAKQSCNVSRCLTFAFFQTSTKFGASKNFEFGALTNGKYLCCEADLSLLFAKDISGKIIQSPSSICFLSRKFIQNLIVDMINII